jgi:hypothetical protein
MTERYRSRNVNNVFPLSSTLIKASDGSTYQSVANDNSFNKSETMTDEVSPGYFAAMRRGQFLPVNPMVQSKGSSYYDPASMTWDITYNGNLVYYQTWIGAVAASCYFWHYSSQFNPPYSGSYPSWPDSSALLTEALAQARSRGFDVLTFLVEFRKTVDLIRNFRERTLNRAEKIAGTIGKSSDPIGEFSSTWLEARYGWRILAYDIAGINQAIDRLNDWKSTFIRGYAEDEAVVSHTVQSYSPANQYMRRYSPYSQAALWDPCTFEVTQSATRNVRAGVILQSLLDDIFELDPLVTTWEVIPFSFIIDWFTNIGDVIEAYSPFATENLLGAWTKETEVITTDVTMVPATTGNPSSGWYYETKSPGTALSCGITNTSVNRQPASPSASLSFKLNLDSLKILDLSTIFFARWAKILGGIMKTNRV